MQVRKTRAICVDGEDWALALQLCPIQSVARQNQSGTGKTSVAVALEIMQVCKTRSVGVDGEDRASAPDAALKCRPIQGVARDRQSRQRESPVAVRIVTRSIVSPGREIMKVRKTRSIRVDGKHRAPAP